MNGKIEYCNTENVLTSLFIRLWIQLSSCIPSPFNQTNRGFVDYTKTLSVKLRFHCKWIHLHQLGNYTNGVNGTDDTNLNIKTLFSSKLSVKSKFNCI